MVRASRPARPDDDLGGPPRAPGAVLTPELADFCQSGISIAVGTCSPAGWPLPLHASGCRIPDLGTVRVLVRRTGAGAALAALAAGAGIAATFSRPYDHRSIQLKAGRATVEAADAADLASAARQLRAFREVLGGVGYPASFTVPFTDHDPADLVALVFVPEEAFVQTPGPGAGSALR
jgi:hypothetical protein